MTPESRSQSRVGLGLRQRQPGLPALTHWQPQSQPRSWTARSLFRVPGPDVAASQSLALAVTGPGDSPAPAESPTRRLDSFQFPSFQVRSLSLPVSSLARPAASHAGGPAVEEPGRPFKLPRAGPLAVGAAEPSARRTRSSGSSLSSLSRTQASEFSAQPELGTELGAPGARRCPAPGEP